MTGRTSSIESFYVGDIDPMISDLSEDSSIISQIRPNAANLDSMNQARESGGACLENAKECAICMDENTGLAVVLPCGHEFHPDCIGQWAVDKSKEAVRTAVTDETFDNNFLLPKVICPLCRDNLDGEAIYNNDKKHASSDTALKNFAKTLQLYVTALYNVKIYQPMVETMVSRLLYTQDDNGRNYNSFSRVPAAFWDTQESLGDYQVFLQSTAEVISEITQELTALAEKAGVGGNIDKALQQKVSDLEYKLEQIYHLMDDCRPYTTKIDENGEPKAFNDKTRLPVRTDRLKALPNIESRLDRLEIKDLLSYFEASERDSLKR